MSINNSSSPYSEVGNNIKTSGGKHVRRISMSADESYLLNSIPLQLIAATATSSGNANSNSRNNNGSNNNGSDDTTPLLMAIINNNNNYNSSSSDQQQELLGNNNSSTIDASQAAWELVPAPMRTPLTKKSSFSSSSARSLASSAQHSRTFSYSNPEFVASARKRASSTAPAIDADLLHYNQHVEESERESIKKRIKETRCT